MTDEALLVEALASGIVVVRLNRPTALNALDADLMGRLEQLWLELSLRQDLRCVVLTGTGRAFCSGADAGFLSAERAPRGAGLDGELAFLPGRVLSVPVVVAVNGICAGGGLHFVSDADIVIASQSASFLEPHVSVGQVSGVEPVALALRLPLPVIARMALLGRAERVTAQRLYDLGLISELVAEGADVVGRAVEIASAIASASPAAVRSTRAALRRLSDHVLEPFMRAGWVDVQQHWSHPDAAEGPRAFAEKRSPVWHSGP